MPEYVYVATVGKTPEKTLVGLRSRLNIKKVHLIGTDDEEVKKCVEYITDFAAKLGYTVETSQVDAYSVLDVTSHINEVIRKNRDLTVVVNVSSGTRVMTIGALLAAYVNKVETIYVPQQVDEKTPLYINMPPLENFVEKISLPKEVLVDKDEILPKLEAHVKQDHPAVHVETLEQLIEKMVENKFKFNAWDTRFERYPNLIRIHEKSETKTVREDVGPYQMTMHFDARCSRCQSWFTFPLEIGLGYIPTAALLSQGEVPPKTQPTPPPFNSKEYAELMLRNQNEFYCQRCTLLLGLNTVIEKLKKTPMVV